MYGSYPTRPTTSNGPASVRADSLLAPGTAPSHVLPESNPPSLILPAWTSLALSSSSCSNARAYLLSAGIQPLAAAVRHCHHPPGPHHATSCAGVQRQPAAILSVCPASLRRAGVIMAYTAQRAIQSDPVKQLLPAEARGACENVQQLVHTPGASLPGLLRAGNCPDATEPAVPRTDSCSTTPSSAVSLPRTLSCRQSGSSSTTFSPLAGAPHVAAFDGVPPHMWCAAQMRHAEDLIAWLAHPDAPLLVDLQGCTVAFQGGSIPLPHVDVVRPGTVLTNGTLSLHRCALKPVAARSKLLLTVFMHVCMQTFKIRPYPHGR